MIDEKELIDYLKIRKKYLDDMHGAIQDSSCLKFVYYSMSKYTDQIIEKIMEIVDGKL
jgi:hypothetical protein